MWQTHSKNDAQAIIILDIFTILDMTFISFPLLPLTQRKKKNHIPLKGKTFNIRSSVLIKKFSRTENYHTKSRRVNKQREMQSESEIIIFSFSFQLSNIWQAKHKKKLGIENIILILREKNRIVSVVVHF